MELISFQMEGKQKRQELLKNDIAVFKKVCLLKKGGGRNPGTHCLHSVIRITAAFTMYSFLTR